MAHGQAKEWLKDYLEDLSPFNAADVEIVCREWRQDASNKRFPRSAEVRNMAFTVRSERALAALPRQAAMESRPQLWWLQPRELWKPHWREEDIPADMPRNSSHGV